MSSLVFRASDLQPIIDHTLNASKWQEQLVDFDKHGNPLTKKGTPAVILAKDHGAYLMSNAIPALRGVDGEVNYCVYAAGCNPKFDADWYDEARSICGGDDFGETLPWAEAIQKFIQKGATKIIVQVSENQLSLTWSKE